METMLVTRTEACRMLGCSESHFDTLRKAGPLKSLVKVDSRHYYRDQIKALLDTATGMVEVEKKSGIDYDSIIAGRLNG